MLSRYVKSPFSAITLISDIDEILANVKEYPGQMYRPAKLRRIFASKYAFLDMKRKISDNFRACRKATMVGDALNEKQMKTVVLFKLTFE